MSQRILEKHVQGTPVERVTEGALSIDTNHAQIHAGRAFWYEESAA